MCWKNFMIWKKKSIVKVIYKTMLSYCLKCKKNTESKNPKVEKTKNGRIMLLSKFTVCNIKKSKFIKDQETKRLLANLLGAKIQILSDIPLVNTLF